MRRTIAAAATTRDYECNLGIIERAVAPSPAVLDRLAELERQFADQARVIEAQGARIAALERASHPAEDGKPRPAGQWCTAKEAAYRTGYSPSGLRKLAKQGRIVFDVDVGRRSYDILSIKPAVRRVR